MVAFQFFKAAWLFIGALVFHKILLMLFEAKTAFWGAIIFALLVGRVNYGGGTPERMLTPFILLSVYCALLTLQSSRWLYQIPLAVLVGASIGLASLIKQPGGLFAAISCSLLLFSKKRISLCLLAVFGILLTTFLSFYATGVAFETILNEAYLVNLQSYMHAQLDPSKQLYSILKGMVGILALEYTALSLGAVAGVAALAYTWKNFKNLSQFQRTLSIYIAVGAIIGIFCLQMGGRFYSNYYIILLAPFAVLTTFGISKYKHLVPYILVCAVLSNLLYNGIFSYQLFKNTDKNWDRYIERVYSEVIKDTQPDDSIWVSHGLHSIYVMSGRRPAVKNIHFTQNINYVDMCLVDEKSLSERRKNPNYRNLISRLESEQPKVVFWMQRAKNSCTDRLKLHYFPEIQQFLEQNYVLKYKDELGQYYLLDHQQKL